MRRIRLNASSLPPTAFLLLLLLALTAQAQSGRRLPKGSAPAPEPPAEPEKTPAAPKVPVEPQMRLFVVTDISMNLNFSVPYPERVQQWVVQRLRESSALEVAAGDSGNRSQAVKRAKASTEGFVIFIQVDENNFGSAPTSTRQSSMDNISISYAVLSPVTGKSKSSGVVYLSQRSAMGVGIGRGRTVPLCYPGVRGNDYVLLQASLEVADRIMSVIGVAPPPFCS